MKTEIVDNTELHRYEVRVDGEQAGFAQYRLHNDAMVFTHTEVDSAYEGQGVGSALARGALDDARAKGLPVVALCPFIKGYVDRHPEYQDLLR